MELPFILQQKIVDFLISLPGIDDSHSQRSFIYTAGLDTQLQRQIRFGTSCAQFFQLLVPILADYGRLRDGRNAIEAVLKAAKNYIGQDKKVYCETLLKEVQRYETELMHLPKVIEDDQLDSEGVQAKLLELLEPLSFDAEIAQHLPHFTGRQWVFNQIDTWLADVKAQRIFWITGKPGVGKTAIASWLCYHRREIAAFHLCCHGHGQKANPRRCVLSIAYQLSSQLVDYQKDLQKELQKAHQEGSKSSKLERLILESNAQTLFEMLIVQPLSRIPSPDRMIVVLIDALDEATESGKNELAVLIASEFVKTPDWLRLIITSRPDPEVMYPFQGLTPYVLDTSSPKNERDLREYLVGQLQPYAGDEKVSSSIIGTIIDRGEGLFLYVQWVCQELSQGRLSLDQAEDFPQGLGGIYAQFFERQFPDIDTYEHQTRPVLEVVTAAQEPPEMGFIADIFDWNEYEQKRFQHSLGSLFLMTDSRIQPFHGSVIDWLTDVNRAGPYFVSVSEGYKRLTHYGWQVFTNEDFLEAKYKVDMRGEFFYKISLPYRLNPYFSGRDTDLIKIQETLNRVQAVAVVGLGGIGKTCLIREYVERYSRFYNQILWVDARLGLWSEFARVGVLLFPEFAIYKEDDKARLAYKILCHRTNRLLVIDNAEDEWSVQEWIPKIGGCHTIITSRFTAWSNKIETYYLDVLESDSARQYLLKRTGREPTPDNNDACDQLAKKLGNFPLALEQAAAYIEHQGESFGVEDYLRLYDLSFRELLSEGELNSTNFSESIITSVEAIVERCAPPARAILRLAAFLPPEPIPIKMFIKGATIVCKLADEFIDTNSQTNPPTSSSKEFYIRESLKELSRYSIITVHDQYFSVHRLIKEVERLNTPDAQRPHWTKHAREMAAYAVSNADNHCT